MIFFTQAFRDEQRRKDEAMTHSMQQLAYGDISAHSILSATSSNASALVTTAATNLYATATPGVVSSQPYYKKEVENAALFMDNRLKISAFDVYTICTDDSMYKFDTNLRISSIPAITEYFNILYYDNLLTPRYKCSYAINDTKNVVKHLDFLTQTFENISHNTGSFPIGKIVHKWEDLHKALI